MRSRAFHPRVLTESEANRHVRWEARYRDPSGNVRSQKREMSRFSGYENAFGSQAVSNDSGDDGGDGATDMGPAALPWTGALPG